MGDEVASPLCDLVSRGKNEENKNQCYGDYDTTTKIGYGPGYINSCIHTDSNNYSGGNTVWYNYALASAGTIVNEDASSTTGTTTTATESICPKGWTLPTATQTRSIGPSGGSATYVSIFSPVLGGYYNNGSNGNSSSDDGRWWGSTAPNTAQRYHLTYRSSDSSLVVSQSRRSYGLYIRCVQAS